MLALSLPGLALVPGSWRGRLSSLLLAHKCFLADSDLFALVQPQCKAAWQWVYIGRAQCFSETHPKAKGSSLGASVLTWQPWGPGAAVHPLEVLH